MSEKETLRICGVDIQREVSDPGDWEPGGMGRSDQLHSRITIRPGLRKDVEGMVMLHETIHMICDMNELKNIRDDETGIAVLANSLNAFLRDNYMKYWDKKHREKVA